jgi:hypothetical protein
MLKVMELKILGIRGSFTFRVQRWVRGGKICREIKLRTDHCSEGCTLGSEGCKLGSEVLFDGFHFGVDGGIHVFIDGDKIGTDLLHFLLGLCKIGGQGIEVSFQVLATSVGHDEEGKRKGMGGTTHKIVYG